MKKHPSKADPTLAEQFILVALAAVLLIIFLWLLANYPAIASLIGGILFLGVFPALFNFLRDLSKKE